MLDLHQPDVPSGLLPIRQVGPARMIREWSIALAALALVALGGALLAQRASNHRLLDRLIAADPDAVLADPALRDTAMIIGKPLFLHNCAACHGEQGRGSTARGVPDLTDGDWLYGEGRVGEIEQIVLHGIRSGDTRGQALADMPAYASPDPYPREHIGALRPGEIEDVATYLRSLHGDAAPADAVLRGKAIFGGKGGCWDCHGGDASGDPAIGAPNLLDDVWLYGDGSKVGITRSIAYGRKGAMPAFSHVLTAQQARAVAAYVAILSRQSQDGNHHVPR